LGADSEKKPTQWPASRLVYAARSLARCFASRAKHPSRTNYRQCGHDSEPNVPDQTGFHRTQGDQAGGASRGFHMFLSLLSGLVFADRDFTVVITG